MFTTLNILIASLKVFLFKDLIQEELEKRVLRRFRKGFVFLVAFSQPVQGNPSAPDSHQLSDLWYSPLPLFNDRLPLIGHDQNQSRRSLCILLLIRKRGRIIFPCHEEAFDASNRIKRMLHLPCWVSLVFRNSINRFQCVYYWRFIFNIPKFFISSFSSSG